MSTFINLSKFILLASVTRKIKSKMQKFYLFLEIRNRTATQLKVLLHIFVGLIIGCLFYGHGRSADTSISNTGFLIITVIYLSYTALIPAVVGFPNEVPIIKKENFNNWYKLRTYYLATIVASLPAQFLYAFAYSTIAYTLSGQPLEINRYSMFLIITILINIIADSIGLLIGTLLNPVNGTFVGAVLTAYWLLLGGFLIFFKHMSMAFYLLSYTSFIAYGWEGLMQSIYGFDREKIECPLETTYCPYVHPESLLTDMGMATEKHIYGNDVMTLVGQIFIIKIIAFFTLKRMLKKN